MAEQKKSRKHGRDKLRCAAYRTAQRREFNKARRLIKHMRKHPNTKGAAEALERLKGILFDRQRKELGLTGG